MKKKTYIEPIAVQIFLVEESEPLCFSIKDQASGADHSLSKGTVFDAEEAEATTDNESNDWFNDSKSGW